MVEKENAYVKALVNDEGGIRVTMSGRTFEVIRLMAALAKTFLSDRDLPDLESRRMFKDLIDDIFYVTSEKRGEGWAQAVFREMDGKTDRDIKIAN